MFTWPGSSKIEVWQHPERLDKHIAVIGPEI